MFLKTKKILKIKDAINIPNIKPLFGFKSSNIIVRNFTLSSPFLKYLFLEIKVVHRPVYLINFLIFLSFVHKMDQQI